MVKSSFSTLSCAEDTRYPLRFRFVDSHSIAWFYCDFTENILCMKKSLFSTSNALMFFW